MGSCSHRKSQVDLDDNLRIWRSFQLGNLLDLIILDTRNYDRSITTLGISLSLIFLDHRVDLDQVGMTITSISSVMMQAELSWGRTKRTGSTGSYLLLQSGAQLGGSLETKSSSRVSLSPMV
jgi:hypothetical protein